MPFCTRCGTKYDDSANFCSNCGLAFSKAKTENRQEQEQEGKTAPGPDFFIESLRHITDTNDTTSSFEKQDIEQNRAMAIIAYLGVLVVIPILTAGNSKFARFHSNQGLILLITEFIWFVATSIYSAYLGLIKLGPFAVLYHVTIWPLSFLFLVLMIFGIYNAANGRAKELPLIGKFRILKY